MAGNALIILIAVANAADIVQHCSQPFAFICV